MFILTVALGLSLVKWLSSADLPPQATGQAPSLAVVTTHPSPGQTHIRWRAPIYLAGVVLASDGEGTVDLGDGPQPLTPTSRWLDAQCRTIDRRPDKDASCRVSAVWATHLPGAEIIPVYSGTRIWTRDLDEPSIELLAAYGVGPTAPAPDPSELRAGEALVLPSPQRVTTEAKIVALGPGGPDDTITREIPGLHATARLPVGQRLVPLLSMENVPIVIQTDTGVGSTVPLAATAARLRFGWADTLEDVDGNGELQPRDLFPGIDHADVATPGTDVLVRGVLGFAMSADQPWISPIPDAAPALLILTADQDYAPSEAVLAQSAAAGENGMTVLLTDPTVGREPDVTFADGPAGMLGASTLSALSAHGHGVGIHPFVGNWPEHTTIEIADQFYRVAGARPTVVRNHHVSWSLTTPAAQDAAGLRLGLDYIAQASAGSDLGFLGGTGVAMKYPGTEVFHLPTHLDDHVLLPERFGYRAYTVDQLIARSEAILDTALLHHSVIVANHHPIWWIKTDGKWQSALIAAAHARKIPVWGATQYLRYLEGARSAVICKTPDGHWQVLAPESGVTVLWRGNRFALRGGARILSDAPVTVP
jgi:hypothetical protein